MCIRDRTGIDQALVSDLKPQHPVLAFGLDNNNVIIALAVPVTQVSTDRLLGAVIVRAPSPDLESELQDTSGLGTSGKILLSDFVAQKVSVLSFSKPGEK